MKTVTTLILIVSALLFSTQCAIKSQNVIAALTPATSIVTTQYPQHTESLVKVTETLDSVVATSAVSPADLVVQLKPLKKNPEVASIVQLILAVYIPSYSPSADNVSKLKAISEAVKAGLPKP